MYHTITQACDLFRFHYLSTGRCTGGDAKETAKLGNNRENIEYRAEIVQIKVRLGIVGVAEKRPFYSRRRRNNHLPRRSVGGSQAKTGVVDGVAGAAETAQRERST